VLDSRFGQFSPQVIDYLKKVEDPFVLKMLIQQAATTPSLDDFLKHVPSNS